jgi:maltose operon protein
MLKETEDLYNHLITQAVANKDIDKALKLVEEAERAGSGTARAVFIEQVKALN